MRSPVLSFPGLVIEAFFLPFKRFPSFSDGVGQFVCFTPPRSNQNVANLCPVLWTERDLDMEYLLDYGLFIVMCILHPKGSLLEIRLKGLI